MNDRHNDYGRIGLIKNAILAPGSKGAQGKMNASQGSLDLLPKATALCRNPTGTLPPTAGLWGNEGGRDNGLGSGKVSSPSPSLHEISEPLLLPPGNASLSLGPPNIERHNRPFAFLVSPQESPSPTDDAACSSGASSGERVGFAS